MKAEQLTGNALIKQPGADLVEITFYTDPLCCWSWGFEPQWRRLQYEYRDYIVFRYVMSGLLPSWQNYNDPMFSISRPAQMGPLWHEVSQATGMEIYDKMWFDDPPASSYPACIAVKCAGLQSPQAEIKYLRLTREAAMLHGKNIAKQEVLSDIARQLATDLPGTLDADRFITDLTGTNGIEAFRADLNEVQNRNISRFPTLIIRSTGKPAILITGYRPYPVLLEAIQKFIPVGKQVQKASSKESYVKFWGSITPREIEEAFTQ